MLRDEKEEGTEPLDLKWVNEMLRDIVGLPLTEIWRGGGQAFDFGEQIEYTDKAGEDLIGSTYTVKYLGAWRVTCNSRIVFGSGDHGTKRRFYDRKSLPKIPSDRESWVRANEFLEKVDNSTLFAVDAKLDDSLVLKIKLSDDFEIVGIASSAEWQDIFYFSDRDEDWSCLVTHSGIYTGFAEAE